MKIGEEYKFLFRGKTILFTKVNSRIYINSTQIAKIFYKLPHTWLRLKETIEIRVKLIDQNYYTSLSEQLITTKGLYGATWIEVNLAQFFIKWLQDDLVNWFENCIKDLLLSQNVAIYFSLVNSQNNVFNIPKTFKDALKLALTQLEIIEKQEEIILNNHK